MAALLAVGLFAGSALGSAGGALGAAHRLTPARVGSVPHLPRHSRVLGALAGTTQLSVDVTLAPRDPAALASYATAVATPGSPDFRHYLTPSQFREQFGPTSAQVAAVQAELRSSGLKPGAVTANGLEIPVSATAAKLSHAFSTSLEQVQLASGRTAYTNTVAPKVGATAAGLVQGVVGLSSLSIPQPLGLQRASSLRARAASAATAHEAHARADTAADTTGPQPCADATDAASEYGSYTEDQIASAYGLSSLYADGDEGSGQTVALLELASNKTSDITAFQSCYGTDATVNYIKEDGGANSRDSGAEEADLDIEQVIGLAPQATVDVYQAPNSATGLLDDYTAMIDADTAKAISTSWGECESGASSLIQSESTLFEQAATEGISVYAAAGDDGSSDCGTSALSVDDPGSQPYVTSVGGTSLPDASDLASQTTWNDSGEEEGAGGGGISSSWTMPSFQSDASASLGVIGADSSGSPCAATSGYCREVPDVSADADPYTGYVIYYDGEWDGGFGGTSAAAPLWAALTALANASSSCDGTTIGFANPLLYGLASDPSDYAADFTDITAGNNDYTPDGYGGGLYPAQAGYDMATGIGTPVAATLVPALCAAAVAESTGTGTGTTTTGTGTGTTTTGTGTGTTTTGTGTGTTTTGTGTGTTTTGTGTGTTTTGTGTTPTGTTTNAPPVGPSSCPPHTLLTVSRFEGGQPGHRKATLTRALTLASGCTAYELALSLHVGTTRGAHARALDTLKLQILVDGKLRKTIVTFSNRNARSGYRRLTYSVARYAGERITLRLLTHEHSGGTTEFTVKNLKLDLS